LVIDDNSHARSVLAEMLADMGFHVDESPSGEDAIEMVQQLAHSGGFYDIAFIDWQMPGLDGVETGKRILAVSNTDNPPHLVMVTAYGRQDDLNLRYAWPSGIWGSLPIEGGVSAAYKREIEASEDPETRRKELEAYYDRLQSPFRTAEKFGVQDIIDPRETRPILCDWVEQAYDVLPQQLGPIARTLRV